jgi:hypothetical protein
MPTEAWHYMFQSDYGQFEGVDIVCTACNITETGAYSAFDYFKARVLPVVSKKQLAYGTLSIQQHVPPCEYYSHYYGVQART